MGGKSVAIIGAGFAGLSAGIYALLNGYRPTVFEMHTIPGGLCTSWKRKGYVIDGCVHWLMGSAPGSEFNDMWRTLGLMDGITYVDHDVYATYVGEDGRVVTVFCDADRLERHLLEVAPQDAAVIRETTAAIRKMTGFSTPMPKPRQLMRFADGLKMLKLLPHMGLLKKYLKVSMGEYAQRFQDPLLRKAFAGLFAPDFPAIFMLMTLAYLHRRDAGYPLGGSMALALRLARRYKELGGEIRYRSRVSEIRVEGDRACGVRLADGTEFLADHVISAADGHTTIFELLAGRYVDAAVREPYETYRPFPPLLLAGIGFTGQLPEVPRSVAGMFVDVREPLKLGDQEHTRLAFHPFDHDPSFAPPGCTVLTCMLETRWEHWDGLRNDRAAYDAEKARVLEWMLARLDQRFPGFRSRVEMTDLSTPLTFERYTGAWRGSFEGFIATPSTLLKELPHTLPGLKGFVMAGHWVEPGGGLPPAAYSGRNAIMLLAHQDGRKFTDR
jgi:phytoene dehydrogenase-like protein